MAYPAGVVTTQLTFGTAQAMIGQDALAMTVKLTPTTNLVYGGNVFIADTKTIQVAAGGSGAVTLINPDQAGFFNGGGLAIRNWGYTFEITYSNGSAALYTAPPKIITWFASDAGPLDVDTMVPIADGSGILVPASSVASAIGQLPSTTDSAVAALLSSATATRGKLDARYSTGIATPEMYRASATVDGNGNVTDWAPAITAAITAGYRDIELAAGYYTCRTPIRVPTNIGLSIRAKSALKGSVLDFYLPAGNDNNAAIDVLGETTGTGYNFAGFTLENVHIKGNNSVAHGVRIQDLSYPWIENVAIEGFRGAGLLLDLVMDGYINVTIQDSGRTTGDYTSLADRSNNAKTTYSALHFMATRAGDHCNMLRITGDVEQNKVSPYVWVHDAGAIGLWFSDIHGETRNSADFGNFDFLVSDGADCEFTGMNLAGTFRNGFLLGGYGVYRFSGGRYLHNIRNTDSNTTGRLILSNVSAGNVAITAWGGQHVVTGGSQIKNLNISYPSQGPTFIDHSFLANMAIDHAGAGVTAVITDGCYMQTYTTDANTLAFFLRNSDLSGALNAQGSGSVENTGIGGSVATGSSVHYTPRS